MDENKLREDIKNSFSKVTASEETKRKTKLYIDKKTTNYCKKIWIAYPQMNFIKYASCIIACMTILLFGGYRFYFEPIASISIDINPSIELEVNRLGKVIFVKGYNEDGISLVDKLDLEHKSYYQAISEMLDNETISKLMEKDETLCIGVIGKDNKTTVKMFKELECFCEKKENIECYFEHQDKVKEAHELGLSYGKYKAYLEYKKIDDSITIEDIKDMTMKEIRQHISPCINEGNCENKQIGDKNQRRNGHHQGQCKDK